MNYTIQKQAEILKVKFHNIFFLFLFFFFTGCATSDIKIPVTPPVKAEAEALWEKFIFEKKTKNIIKPYSLSGSLRFGYANRTHRVTYILWANGQLPLRLDIQAGVGASIAKIEETEKALLVYFSQEKKAIKVSGGSKVSALLALGMPMPISFLDLSYLLRGNFAHAFGGISLSNIDLDAGVNTEEKYLFHFENKEFFGSIRLNSLALPVESSINDEWQIFIEYDEKNLPYKVELSSLFEEYSAILLIKENKTTSPYPKEQLKLLLPEGTPVVSN